MDESMRRLTVCLAAVSLMALVGSVNGAAAQPTHSAAVARPTPPPMAPEEMRAFLAQPLVARLATVRPNGAPQVFPMWFLYEDGVLYMSTRTQAAKLRHIRRNPRVAVVIDVMEAPLKNKVVTIDGTAEILTTNVQETTAKIYQKYMGAEAARSAAAQQNISTPRVILKITPKKIQTVDTTMR